MIMINDGIFEGISYHIKYYFEIGSFRHFHSYHIKYQDGYPLSGSRAQLMA